MSIPESPVIEPQLEKRLNRRFSLDLPVVVKFLDDGIYEVRGHTRDVSSCGVFFYVDSEILPGAVIQFVMTLPSEITMTEPIRVQCLGKVVRVDQHGVAVAVEKYDFVREG